MKNLKIFILAAGALMWSSCHDLDLNPLSDPATGNFYSNETELTVAINDLYRIDFIGNDDEEFSDNCWNRGSGGNAVTYGTMASDDSKVLTYWTNCYKAIARANTIIGNLDRATANTSAAVLTSIEAQARFARAYQYSRLITHFGGVPFLDQNITLDEAYSYTKSSKEVVLAAIYEDLDFAADHLPTSYTASSDQRWTKGIALSVKARTALYMGDYATARSAAKAVMDLKVYELYPSFRNLFLSPGQTSKEVIWNVPRSEAASVVVGSGVVTSVISRNSGGYGSIIPTWSLVDAFECSDGLPVDESPLYNPQKPFENRDPRLSETIVPFGTNWLGFSYQPHPDSIKVMSYKTNAMVSNKDCRTVTQYASYTGFLWKKGVDDTWPVRKLSDFDLIMIRYPEVLLTYAEASVETNQIDASVLNAINRIRARAYGVDVAQTTLYPAITTTDADELRTIIKRERRVEFAFEGLRYMDLIRWKLAEKALTQSVVGLADPQNQDRDAFPFAGPPAIDQDGIPDYTAYLAKIKLLADRKFDKTRQYLWPIPAIELRVNPDLQPLQNPNY